MSLTYFKRYRMEFDLRRPMPAAVLLPGYRLIPWQDSLLEVHAETKFQSFHTEIDANVFPCLADRAGCLRLMREIVQKEGFLPSATWLLAFDGRGDGRPDYCGTIQGIREKSGQGAVQNLGITPSHRDRGLGTMLMLQSLQGFRLAGLRWAMLEVTAQNDGAIRLYRRMGFSKARTVYKPVEVVCG